MTYMKQSVASLIVSGLFTVNFFLAGPPRLAPRDLVVDGVHGLRGDLPENVAGWGRVSTNLDSSNSHLNFERRGSQDLGLALRLRSDL